jgi:FMN phosphatase YigB (HAD superfamily)
MTRPDAVVFDLGKVLVDFDYGIAARRLAERGRLGMAAVRELIDHSPLLFRYETGLIDRRQFFEEVRSATGFAGSLEEFGRVFADIFTEIPPMVALQRRLRERGVPTFIFSNTNDIAIGHIRERFPFFAGFDAYVFSYEHRAMKPQAALYEVVERVTGRSGGRLVYLDDRLENVEAGRARGWEIIHHADPAMSIARLQELGLPAGA